MVNNPLWTRIELLLGHDQTPRTAQRDMAYGLVDLNRRLEALERQHEELSQKVWYPGEEAE